MQEFFQFFDPRLHPSMAVFVSQVLARLLMAAILGGLIGLERELKKKSAGLRTNMFICFGAAMFTIMSDRLAGNFGGDHTRIASQIIPGIGFIGAGSILHSKMGTTGLTTAATIFVVASIGMAAGGGLFLPATVATLLLIVALHSLGLLEGRWNLKPVTMTYEVEATKADELLGEINSILEEEHRTMRTVQIGRTDGHYRVVFTVDAMHSEHDDLARKLRHSTAVMRLERVTSTEVE
jgi:putative Mg2+ transporter-C (MgtC) family protein